MRRELWAIRPLEIVASHFAHEAVVLSLAGELDIDSTPSLAEALETWREIERVVCVDLDGVTFVDSSGLRLLLHATRDDDTAVRVYLVNASDAVMRVASLSGTATRLGLAAT